MPRAHRVVAVNTKAPGDTLQGALDGATRTRLRNSAVRRGDPRRTLPRGGARTHGTGRSSGSGFGLGSGLPAPDTAQWRKASSSSLTAAGPPRNHTGFPLSHGSWGRKPGTSAYVVEQLRYGCSPLPGRTRAGEQGEATSGIWGGESRDSLSDWDGRGDWGRLSPVWGRFSHRSGPPQTPTPNPSHTTLDPERVCCQPPARAWGKAGRLTVGALRVERRGFRVVSGGFTAMATV